MKDLHFFSIVLLFYGIYCVKIESDYLAASSADDFQDDDDFGDSGANASKKAFHGNGTLIPGTDNDTLSTADWYQYDDHMNGSKANVTKKEFPRNGTVKATRRKNIFDEYAEYFRKQREEYEKKNPDLFKFDFSGVTYKPFKIEQNDSSKKMANTLYSTLGKVVVIMLIGGGGSACYMRRCKKKSPTPNDDDTIPVIPPDSKV